MKMQPDNQFKAVASVADVARLVGLSRARFYQLVKGGLFPMPVYDVATRRPCYTEEQQRTCVEVRRRNCGINGQPVLFYSRRLGGPTPPARSSVKRPSSSQADSERHSEIVAYLRGLGLADVTLVQVESALKAEYPQGAANVDRGTMLGRLFLRLHRRNTADKVGR